MRVFQCIKLPACLHGMMAAFDSLVELLCGINEGNSSGAVKIKVDLSLMHEQLNGRCK